MLNKNSIIKELSNKIRGGDFNKRDFIFIYHSFLETVDNLNNLLKNEDYKITHIRREILNRTTFNVDKSQSSELNARLFNILFSAEEPFHHIRFSVYNENIEIELLEETSDDCKIINHWFLLVLYVYLIDEDSRVICEELNKFVKRMV